MPPGPPAMHAHATYVPHTTRSDANSACTQIRTGGGLPSENVAQQGPWQSPFIIQVRHRQLRAPAADSSTDLRRARHRPGRCSHCPITPFGTKHGYGNWINPILGSHPEAHRWAANPSTTWRHVTTERRVASNGPTGTGTPTGTPTLSHSPHWRPCKRPTTRTTYPSSYAPGGSAHAPLLPPVTQPTSLRARPYRLLARYKIAATVAALKTCLERTLWV